MFNFTDTFYDKPKETKKPVIKQVIASTVSNLNDCALTLSAQDNTFSITITRDYGRETIVNYRPDFKSVIDTYSIKIRHTTLIQLAMQDVIDKRGTAKVITIGDHSIEMIHFPTGEIGIGVNGEHYQLAKGSIPTLRAWCAKAFY